MASEIKIEPGPWKQWNRYVSGRGRAPVTTIKAASQKTICTLAAGTDEWVNAHGRLLKAAPDLYEALAKVLAHVTHEETTTSSEATKDAMRGIAKFVRAALAKARGEVPRG